MLVTLDLRLPEKDLESGLGQEMVWKQTLVVRTETRFFAGRFLVGTIDACIGERSLVLVVVSFWFVRG